MQHVVIETDGAVMPPGPAGMGALKATGTSESKPLSIILPPARILTGRVTDAETRKPFAGAGVDANFLYGFPARTDADGRFRASALTASEKVSIVTVGVIPPEGQSYLRAHRQFSWPKGAIEHSLDMVLTRGVMIHGTVTEAGSGAPVAGAEVFAMSHGGQTAGQSGSSGPLPTKFDGSFQLVVAPGRDGYLWIDGPSDDYVAQAIGSQTLRGGTSGGRPVYGHAFVPYDAKTVKDNEPIKVVLKRGATVKGRAVGMDGQPVRDAWIFSGIIINGRRNWPLDLHLQVQDGHFVLHGLAPDVEAPVFFLDPRGKTWCDSQCLGQVERWRTDFGSARAGRGGQSRDWWTRPTSR